MLCSYSNDKNNMSTPDVQLIREVSSGPFVCVYIQLGVYGEHGQVS